MKKITETDIAKLKEKRNLNVQEQINLNKDRIMSEAKYWREHGVPAGLKNILQNKDIDIETSIFLEYEQDFPGCSTDEGIVLTIDGKFFEFDADLSPDRTNLLQLYSMKDITDKYEVSDTKKGIGKTYGFLALEVLKELNNK